MTDTITKIKEPGSLVDKLFQMGSLTLSNIFLIFVMWQIISIVITDDKKFEEEIDDLHERILVLERIIE